MAEGKGPAKGAGRVIPRKPFTKENAAEMSAKGVAMRQKFRQWRKEHPEWQEKPGQLSKKDVRDYLNGSTLDAVDAAVQIALDPKHPRSFDAQKFIIEQKIGRAVQAVELTGKDGGPVEVNDARDRIAGKLAGLAAGSDASGNSGGSV